MAKTECGWCEKEFETEEVYTDNECGICDGCLEDPRFIEAMMRVQQPLNEVESISLEDLLKKFSG